MYIKCLRADLYRLWKMYKICGIHKIKLWESVKNKKLRVVSAVPAQLCPPKSAYSGPLNGNF